MTGSFTNNPGNQPRIAPKYNRKARLMDALGVFLLIVFSALMGCIVLMLSVPGFNQ